MPDSRIVGAAMSEEPKTSWPRTALLVGVGLWVLLAGILLPSLDGWGPNFARLGIALGCLMIGLVRWMMAVRRRERNGDWKFHVALIACGPIVSYAAYAAWEHTKWSGFSGQP
jgi:hypothetical protein